MSNPSRTDTARQAALAELASITSIEFGTISEIHRDNPSARRGPYFRHQCWENGRNRSTYIPAAEVEALREDLENGRRFRQITAELAEAAVRESRARRAAAAEDERLAEKKTSGPNASPKNTARRRASSPRRAGGSSEGGDSKS